MFNCILFYILISLSLDLSSVDLAPTTSLSFRTKRWAHYETHNCGKIKGYSCMEHTTCQERYNRKDMVCFEVYPCLSSCIFIQQLFDYEKLIGQIRRLVTEGVPVNTHENAVNYVKEKTKKLAASINQPSLMIKSPELFD